MHILLAKSNQTQWMVEILLSTLIFKKYRVSALIQIQNVTLISKLAFYNL